ncbi:hypothetical protein ACF0H5_016933 [Mactra antiquata]
MEVKVHKIGNVEDCDRRVVRIVHISDTHMRHNDYIDHLPHGDILVHSGDFSAFSIGRYFGNKTSDRDRVIDEINKFFGKVNFEHKVFVPGNHELSFDVNTKAYIEERLTDVHYLQDSSINIEGINIYGSPWNSKRWTSYARGFAKNANKLIKHWNLIPKQTDILVTHLPPEGILDLATKKFSGLKNLFSRNSACDVCCSSHEAYEHWGCKDLRNIILKGVRPTLHLFGHVHEDTGIQEIDGITFSNAALKINQTINVFDYYI